ncbi:MAG TPA: ester cyclase, partial [Gemmatimonadaceae bacterium]|nr:ester cyclase [Gemmatimonadaceae bacterium]
MRAESIQFVDTWFEEVWRKGNPEAIDAMVADDAVMHGLGEADAVVRGGAGFKPFVERMRGAFPDVDIRPVQTVEEDDLIVTRWVATMTHQGDHLGVPATGRRVTVTGVTIVRLQDGKIVEAWNNY